MTDGVGSIAVTEAVDGRRVAEDEKMPPPQPMSRYVYLVSGSAGSAAESWRQVLTKSWRRGFMRWRSREEPCGSHHDEARREKWETSVSETEEVEEGGAFCGGYGLVENGLRVAGEGAECGWGMPV